MDELELWGGVECTVNRIGDAFGDQCARSGHDMRDGDIALFANAGLTALRHPILWEKLAGGCFGLDAGSAEWSRHDARLENIRGAGMRPIVGLVHHGSGPSSTHLLDPEFATGLAAFAESVAARHGWIEDWTPVNEPLTTARFAALYGHWYPHGRDERSFWTALLNQVDAVRLAMRAIRGVNPVARLIQTEDLGRTYATAPLMEQAEFYNVRRWATWDLLCGQVERGHPLWKRLATLGFGERLHAIADDPCPPDVIGINHYLTSDRFLDHRPNRYPPAAYGEGGYADIEAVRALDPAPSGLAGVVREAWARYGIPIAITEVHNGSTRDEQMRWFAEAWDAAVALRRDGIPVQAVTAWSLLGSFDWDTLLTRPGRYEVGVFDVGGGSPRPTAMVQLLRALKEGGERHPVLEGAGWWRRPTRLIYPPVPRPAPMREHMALSGKPRGTRPLLICGATGTLGRAFARACRHRDIAYRLTSRAELDLSDPAAAGEVLDAVRPWAVVNATGWVRVDDAEAEPLGCHRTNVDAAVGLAVACSERGIATATFSSDLVFDGAADSPYDESAEPAPLNVYGSSKLAMERAIAALQASHLVIRTAAFFSPHDEHNFARAVQRELAEGRLFEAAADEVVSPTLVEDLVDRTLDLLIDDASGIWHLVNDDALSWADFARRIAQACGLDATLVRDVHDVSRPAPRPRYSAMGSHRGLTLGPLDRAIEQFARASPIAQAAPRVRAYA